jgi:hypothetical protein
MKVEAELREIKQHLMEMSKKLDKLMQVREIVAMMKLSEKSLKFLETEPDIYSVDDLKVRYQ